jgi:flap endonuclease-1
MGVSLSKLVEPTEITLDALSGKVVAVDAMNMLYQFATTIRQADGTPLKDSKGNVTSHLTGLFARCSKLMQKGIKLIFVFDGAMPKLKEQERAYRQEQKDKALAKLKEATDNQDISEMKKYAGRTTKVTGDMVEESKLLLTALGIPYIVAPSEGEAQAGHLVNTGKADYVASQDFDCLIYGGTKVVRNLSLSNKRKKINALTYTQVLPETLSLQDTLNQLDINLEQLQVLAMLVGTDFNRGGIKGLGPKKSLQLVKDHKDNPKDIFEEIKFNDECLHSWQDILKTIQEMPVEDIDEITWKDVDEEQLQELLVKKHDFSTERVNNAIELINKAKNASRQQSLDSFFG